jgi:hypothetical protein
VPWQNNCEKRLVASSLLSVDTEGTGHTKRISMKSYVETFTKICPPNSCLDKIRQKWIFYLKDILTLVPSHGLIDNSKQYNIAREPEGTARKLKHIVGCHTCNMHAG